jgi:beta-N-acetylhexosaminidase
MRWGHHGSNQARAGWASRAGLVIATTLTLATTLLSGSGHVADHASAQDVAAVRQSSPNQRAADAANANSSGNIPVVASPQFGLPGQTDVFRVAPNGAIEVRWVQGAGLWQGPLPISPPGLAPPGSQVAVSNQFGEPDQTDVFVVGNDGAVHVVWAVGAGGWGGPLPVSPPGLAVAGASVAVSNQFGEPDQTDVFVVGNDGPVHVVWAVGAGAWGGPLTIFSAEQLAGQRVIYSYSGLTPPATLLQRISAGEAAGVIFFSQNIASDAQISAVIQELQSAETQSEVRAPLLMMTDQEGGEVRRLPGAPDLSEKEIGESANPPSAASQAGTGAGENLASVGMNVNLAPVLDVYRQAGDFIDQYQRSYSMDPQVVANLGQNFITAQQATGVAATGKHFPGLGAAATNQDTDVGPVTLNVPLSTLRSVDEVPYQSAIAAGVKLVMVSWAVYPALDATLPAGLSPTVVQQELRGRLGFQGVTITDALEAGALEAYGSSAQRGVLAAQAGMDLLLCSEQNDAQGASTTDALATAYQSGSLNAAAFLASAQRVMALRASVR